MLVDILSRAQFGFSIGFHILFPTLNLGLALFLVIMEGCWLSTRNPIYLKICKLWTKIFALTFGMGVVSGIVLAYQIGTNFGPFISLFGNVLGALFAYETLTAFFLEAGFLGLMLFGWNKVPARIHFIATVFVALGTTISAFWIMSANSWMQTPAGYEFLNDKYLVNDWWAVVFNPSFIPRFIHMLLSSYVTTSFVIISVSSYYLLRNKSITTAKTSLTFALWAAFFLCPLQIGVGDYVGLNVLHYQPLKTAAMEGLWTTQKGAPLLLFALPSQQKQANYFEIAIPKLASFINTHQWDGEMKGLSSAPQSDQPQVAPVFITFRIMVGIGFIMLFTASLGIIFLLRKTLFRQFWFQHWCVITAPLGFIASICGWLTAELGRQPWVVYNLLRTKNATSNLGFEEVVISFTLLLITYGFVFSFYIYYSLKLIRQGTDTDDATSIDEHAFPYMTDTHSKGK